MRIDPIRSFLGRQLPKRLAWRNGGGIRGAIWESLWSYYAAGSLPVRVFLHGRNLLLNPGSPYPRMVMEHKNFNAWLASAARVIAELAGRPVNFVDVGAGVGDTVALVHEQLGVNLGSCICIDGAEDNRPLLEHNLAFHPSVEIVIAMLAARPGSVPSLVRHHAGTAAALGSSQATARTLDEVLASIKGRKPCDLLKIDTDGFDGEVLAGAMDFLRTERPVLCFEWHPALVERCGRAYSTAFEVLRATDYTALIWLRNTGSLSHWTVSVPESVEIEKLDRLLRTRNQPFDPHYDIIALPREKAAWLDALVAEMPFP